MTKKISNTTKIGTEFENKIFDIFSSLLNKDEVPNASKKYSKIFKHKKYKCSNTSRTIDFEITIENYNPYINTDTWSSLIVIECKNYTNKVDISDLDEFSKKISLISTSAIKGIFVTTVGFSQTEIEQAQSEHIALIVANPSGDLKWLVSGDLNKYPEQLWEFLIGNAKTDGRPVVYDDNRFTNIEDILLKYGAAVSFNNVIIPYITEDDLKKIVDELCSTYKLGNDKAGELLVKAFPSYRVDFVDMPYGVLCHLDLKSEVIYISNSIINDFHRMNFTLAHELGHLILHVPLFQKMEGQFDDFERLIIALPETKRKRMEMQADLFASYLLIKQDVLMKEVARLFTQFSVTKGRLYLDNQRCNISLVNSIVNQLSTIFNVSKEAIKVRLQKENLLVVSNNYSPQRMERYF